MQDFLVNKIQRINPKTGKIDEFDIPYTAPLLPVKAPGRTGLTACAIQPGEDGNIYAATGVRNQFVKVDLATKNPKISVFDTGSPQNPLGNLQPFNDLWRGKDGVSGSRSRCSPSAIASIFIQDLRLTTSSDVFHASHRQ